MDELYMHGCTRGIYSGCVAVEWRTKLQPCVVPLSRRSTQLATWFVMPFYQVYSEAGDFSVKNKCDIMITVLPCPVLYGTHFFCRTFFEFRNARERLFPSGASPA